MGKTALDKINMKSKKPSELFEGENSSLRKTFTGCLCGKEITAKQQKQIGKEFKENWEEAFDFFYDKNENGGSSRWLVSPNAVKNFIKCLLN